MGAKPPAIWPGLFGASTMTETAKFFIWSNAAPRLDDLAKELG